MKNMTLNEFISTVEVEQGPLRLHKRGVIERRASLFIVGLAGWSGLSVSLGNILFQNRQNLVTQNVVIELFDMDTYAMGLESIYSPLFDARKISEPIIGHWQSANLEWVDYSFSGAQRMLESIQIPIEILRAAWPAQVELGNIIGIVDPTG